MKNTDYIIINVNNNNCGYICMENKAYECSKEEAFGMIIAARNSGCFTHEDWVRFENGDQQYIFN